MIFGFLLLPKTDAKQFDYGISPINTIQDYDAAISRIEELLGLSQVAGSYTKTINDLLLFFGLLSGDLENNTNTITYKLF
ncbi:hypothetical protein GCM10027284_08100 [Cyclobacterium sediminis]